MVDASATANVARPAENLAVHEVQPLSDSVSHAERPAEAAVDRVFAGL
jgi:hypothetical protein